MPNREVVDNFRVCHNGYCTFVELLQERGIPVPVERRCYGAHGQCPIKEAVASSSLTDMDIVQFACLEELKLAESQQAGRDIGRQHAREIWAKGFYTIRVCRLYKSGMNLQQLYRALCNRAEGAFVTDWMSV